MFLLEKIENAINRNIEISDKLYAVENEIVINIGKNMEDNVQLLTMLMSIVPALRNMGLDIAMGVVQNQLERVENSLEKKDFMLLADVLRYEVNDTLLVLKELVIEGVIKNEELL